MRLSSKHENAVYLLRCRHKALVPSVRFELTLDGF
jgi:hypothetical protein